MPGASIDLRRVKALRQGRRRAAHAVKGPTMGWEARGCGGRLYYFRYQKVNGRVTRQYIGTGAVAELAAAADALRQADRRAAMEARRAEVASWQAALAPLLELGHVADLLARAALLGAGYRQHARSSWRMRRHVHHDDSAPEAGQ
jgi:hypothetical protein